MRIEDFPCYPHTDLKDIKIGGKIAESVTYSFGSDHIKNGKMKAIKNALVNDKDCFIASKQIDSKGFHFKNGTEADIDCPFIYEYRCVCIGSFPYNYKGFRMKAYVFQYI